MLFSELCGKLILDISSGTVLGSVDEADLLIDEMTGKIEVLILPGSSSRYYRHQQLNEMQIRWQNIKTIGPEFIVAEVNRDMIPL